LFIRQRGKGREIGKDEVTLFFYREKFGGGGTIKPPRKKKLIIPESIRRMKGNSFFLHGGDAPLAPEME